ncbi:hypothetical protein KIW84_042426 [Lathyrus oleraceus]|uniref:Retroviral polymerase SH3-like domain-containing protein n=1 Tax=Pisum sativum TaxID=3888 RepID=A0A9D5AMN6_PEA|nr:hypothetical protein KIW84_042426 [Pisum sativum]
MVRSMMSHADLPNSFWGHALLTAAYTLNHVPSKKVEKTPYEIWSGKKPHMSYIKIWGCEVYVKRQISTKLEPKSDKCLFVEYPKEKGGYYFYNPSEGKMSVVLTGVFLEKDFISKRTSGRKVELEEIQESQSIDTPMDELEQETQVVVSKQDTVADSTTEAECIAASSAAKEAVWIKKFISELGIVPSIVDPIGLYYDNNGAIAQAKVPRSHQRSKHILRRYHLIREIIDRGDMKICRVPTLDNIADPLTKPLAQQKHDGHTRSMGIKGGWTVHDRNGVYLSLEVGNWPVCGTAVPVLNHIQTWYGLGGQSGEVCVHRLSCIMISAA